MHLIKNILLAAVCCLLQSNILLLAADTDTDVTTKATTTTAKPETTTTLSTSTVTPVTSSTQAPEPKPQPQAKFPENIGSWNVSEANVTCIVMKSAFQLSINFTDTNNKTNVAKVDVPVNATATGKCTGESKEQTLTLTWSVQVQDVTVDNSVILTFALNETESTNTTKASGNFFVQDIAVRIYKDEVNFLNATNRMDPFTGSIKGKPEMVTPVNNSYSCKSSSILHSADGNFSLEIENAQVEAFRKGNDAEFSKEYVCEDDINNVVPIAVGAIVAIILIVLVGVGLGAFIVFFIKKRQAQGGSGYENM